MHESLVSATATPAWPTNPAALRDRFCAVPVESAARRLAGILEEEAASALTSYDPAGGYGHPDHVHVHRVGSRAAELAATPLLLEATIDRRTLQRALRAVGWATARTQWRPSAFDLRYCAHKDITHRVDVSAFVAEKRAAMQAHVTQTAGGADERTLASFLRLPMPVFRLAFGREWFVERRRKPSRTPLDDPLASLR